MPPRNSDYVQSLLARASEVLAEQFPPHVPEEQDGWLLFTRSGRPVAAWDLAVKIAADTPAQADKRLELAKALAAAGFAVTLTSNAYMVFFADAPADTSGPRYVCCESDPVLAGVFGGGWMVVDTYTDVPVAHCTSEAAAQAKCLEITERQNRANSAGRESARMPQHPADCSGGCDGEGLRFRLTAGDATQEACSGRPFRFTVLLYDEDTGADRLFLETDDADIAAEWADSYDEGFTVKDRNYVPPAPPVDLQKYDCPF